MENPLQFLLLFHFAFLSLANVLDPSPSIDSETVKRGTKVVHWMELDEKKSKWEEGADAEHIK